MHSLLSLLSILGTAALLNAAPTMEACKEEIRKAKECASNIPVIIKLVTKEEFQRNEKTKQSFFDCLGEPQCDITKSIIKMEQEQLDVVRLMTNIYGCLAPNENYEKAKNSCSRSLVKGNCSYDAFIDCIALKLSTKPECSAQSLIELQNLKLPMGKVCQSKLDHHNKFAKFGRNE